MRGKVCKAKSKNGEMKQTPNSESLREQALNAQL
jgi:hypothetical protein